MREKQHRQNIKESGKYEFGKLVLLGCGISTSTPAAYQRSGLLQPYNGSLILRRVSRLDAFSAYPGQT